MKAIYFKLSLRLFLITVKEFKFERSSDRREKCENSPPNNSEIPLP